MIQSRNQIKQWFKKFAYPTASQFWDWLDSFWHKDDKIPVSQIEGLQGVVDGVKQGIDDALNQKQNIQDESLQTYSKEIVPAINEVKQAVGRIEELAESCHCKTFDIKITEDDGTVTLIRACGEVIRSGYSSGGSNMIGDYEQWV